MDKANGNKRKTFSPSSIEQVEQDTDSCLCGSENRYDVPDEWKGRELGLWEQLHTEFPAPSNLQAKANVFKFYLNCSDAGRVYPVCSSVDGGFHTGKYAYAWT